ncbi:hypothetical protein D0C36_17245 [Mucilaginibacter conchicola]|uniref:Uncharacterized protein n=1 Tax=Mucilaginibacter conchicola TaxID=2303333 RepID=A0A372NP37_9SPHI|nr:hypothetical protein [Mucilaginibacter conchicola]RFZ90706.1 hypothetical protein D0C36_17245 [Mucilaginibacter conchicola]
MKKQYIFFSLLIAIGVIAISSFKSVNKSAPANCMMAVTYSEMAMIQFKKAYKAKTIEAAQPFIKKGMEQVQQASAYAVQCDCTQSESNALTAYGFGKKALDATELEKMKPEAKKAMDLSITAMAAAQRCDK